MQKIGKIYWNKRADRGNTARRSKVVDKVIVSNVK